MPVGLNEAQLTPQSYHHHIGSPLPLSQRSDAVTQCYLELALSIWCSCDYLYSALVLLSHPEIVND